MPPCASCFVRRWRAALSGPNTIAVSTKGNKVVAPRKFGSYLKSLFD
jgi:hypothetical protein